MLARAVLRTSKVREARKHRGASTISGHAEYTCVTSPPVVLPHHASTQGDATAELVECHRAVRTDVSRIRPTMGLPRGVVLGPARSPVGPTITSPERAIVGRPRCGRIEGPTPTRAPVPISSPWEPFSRRSFNGPGLPASRWQLSLATGRYKTERRVRNGRSIALPRSSLTLYFLSSSASMTTYYLNTAPSSAGYNYYYAPYPAPSSAPSTSTVASSRASKRSRPSAAAAINPSSFAECYARCYGAPTPKQTRPPLRTVSSAPPQMERGYASTHRCYDARTRSYLIRSNRSSPADLVALTSTIVRRDCASAAVQQARLALALELHAPRPAPVLRRKARQREARPLCGPAPPPAAEGAPHLVCRRSRRARCLP